MIIASIKDNQDETFLFVNDDMKALKEQLHDFVEGQDYIIEDVLQLTVVGASYRERKDHVHDLAVEWSYTMGYGSITMAELCDIAEWFERQGKRYGLLSEFRENLIVA